MCGSGRAGKRRSGHVQRKRFAASRNSKKERLLQLQIDWCKENAVVCVPGHHGKRDFSKGVVYIWIKDLHALCTETAWLSDAIVNGFTAIVVDKQRQNQVSPITYIHSASVAHKKNETDMELLQRLRYRKLPNELICQFKLVFFPFHVNNNHWIVGVADIENQRFEFYDPMCGSSFRLLLCLMQVYVNNTDDWSLLCHTGPKQSDAVNCGVYVCKFIDFRATHSASNTMPQIFDFVTARRDIMSAICSQEYLLMR